MQDLNQIRDEIATLSTKMVVDAWRVGHLLLTAREQFDNDTEFGRWRAEHLEPLGIGARTARRMTGIARQYPTQTALPAGVNLSTLYLLCSSSTDDRTHAALTQAIEDKPELSYREASAVVAEARNAVRREHKDEGAPVLRLPKVAVPEVIDTDLEWAKTFVKALKGKSDAARMRRLNAMICAMKRSGLLVCDEDAQDVTVHATRRGRIEISR